MIRWKFVEKWFQQFSFVEYGYKNVLTYNGYCKLAKEGVLLKFNYELECYDDYDKS